jgi:malonyl-CoA/methylmalonyl-CoA synthetase
MNTNLFQRISDAVADTGKLAVETATGRRYTYEDLILGSGRFANALLDRGVKPGDRVAVQVEKSVEALILYLACLRAGAVYLPLNTAYTLTELEYFIGDAEPALVVCDPAKRDGLAPIAERANAALETLDKNGQGSIVDLAAADSRTFLTAVVGEDDLAAILYTSGTTGRSKGAMLTHGNLLSNAMTLRDVWRFTPDDVLLHALPIYHTHGLFVASNVTFMSGASMIFCPRFDPDEVMRLLPRTTVMMGVPTFYPPPEASRPEPGGDRTYAPLRVRLCAAPGRDASRME